VGISIREVSLEVLVNEELTDKRSTVLQRNRKVPCTCNHNKRSRPNRQITEANGSRFAGYQTAHNYNHRYEHRSHKSFGQNTHPRRCATASPKERSPSTLSRGEIKEAQSETDGQSQQHIGDRYPGVCDKQTARRQNRGHNNSQSLRDSRANRPE
jgi:hypothetical protein